MSWQDKFERLSMEIRTLIVRQVELGTINPMDVFPPTNQPVISGQGKDGAGLLYLNSLIQRLVKL